MHRQSLGSPVSKLHSHGGAKDQTVNESLAPSSSLADYDEECKSTKLHRLSLSSPPSRPHKLIHLIPLLTLLCFLLLYLSSHDPSLSELAQINKINRSAKRIDSDEMKDIGGLIELRNGNIVAIQSLRNLRELGQAVRKNRTHRKFADFW